jgi:hypothetical protein
VRDDRCEIHDAPVTLFCSSCTRAMCEQCPAPLGRCQTCEVSTLASRRSPSLLAGMSPKFVMLLLFVFFALAATVGGCVGAMKWLEHNVHT